MAKLCDVKIGAVFGSLTVTGKSERSSKTVKGLRKYPMAVCACVCGRVVTVQPVQLKLHSSCGCGYAPASKTHGMSNTSTYEIWQGMLKRTLNPACVAYPRYKNYAPPERWLMFENFLADMGERPEGMTLERKRNDEPYGPTNCVWATYSDQMDNTRRSQRVEYRGKLYTLAELSALSGKPYDALRYRFTQLWSAEDAVNLPYGSSPKSKLKESALKRLYPPKGES